MNTVYARAAALLLLLALCGLALVGTYHGDPNLTGSALTATLLVVAGTCALARKYPN